MRRMLDEKLPKPLGMTMHELSLTRRVAPNRVTQIVDGRRA